MKYFLLLVLISGCATATSVGMKDGKMLYQIECSRHPGDCYKKASQTCNGYYDILNTQTQKDSLVPVGNTMVAVGNNYLIVTCK